MAPTKLPPATNIVNVQGVSDGDANHRPSGNSFSRSDAEVYMRKIATKWVEEEGKGLKPGKPWRLLMQIFIVFLVFSMSRCQFLEVIMQCFLMLDIFPNYLIKSPGSTFLLLIHFKTRIYSVCIGLSKVSTSSSFLRAIRGLHVLYG